MSKLKMFLSSLFLSGIITGEKTLSQAVNKPAESMRLDRLSGVVNKSPARRNIVEGTHLFAFIILGLGIVSVSVLKGFVSLGYPFYGMSENLLVFFNVFTLFLLSTTIYKAIHLKCLDSLLNGDGYFSKSLKMIFAKREEMPSLENVKKGVYMLESPFAIASKGLGFFCLFATGFFALAIQIAVWSAISSIGAEAAGAINKARAFLLSAHVASVILVSLV